MSCSHGQGRIIHCAGFTMEGGPTARGPPINCQIFTTLCFSVLTFERVQCYRQA